MSTGEKLRAIGELIRTQDNRATNLPLFAVQEKRRMYWVDGESDSQIVWLSDDGLQADTETHKKLEANYDDPIHKDWMRNRSGEWTRTGYVDLWEFVTACFTEQGCKDFIRINGHNLNEPRFYAYSGWRNAEWETIRNALRGLPHESWPFDKDCEHIRDTLLLFTDENHPAVRAIDRIAAGGGLTSVTLGKTLLGFATDVEFVSAAAEDSTNALINRADLYTSGERVNGVDTSVQP